RGYVEGRHFTVEWRTAQGDADTAEGLAADLVSKKVDVIVAVQTVATQAATKATSSIPIVMASAADPLESGLVKSLAHPGGNVTGLSANTGEISGKRISILRELIPQLKTLGVLINSQSRFSGPFVQELRAPATRAGITLHVFDVRKPEDVDAGLAALKKMGADAVMLQTTLLANPKAVADSALQHRLPVLGGLKQFVKVGGLVSYVANADGQVKRAAEYVDKIIKGANPGALPIEQATEFELVI